MSFIRQVSIAISLVCFTAFAQAPVPQADKPVAKGSLAQKEESCEHGVKKTICTRCNPKLAAVYKAKGDWCSEHARAESQCSICNPELAKQGVK